MNAYQEYTERRQAAVNALPFHWAFGKEQFNQLMKDLGLNPNKKSDMAQLCSGPAGSIIFKKDLKMIREKFTELNREKAELIRQDQTGDGFIYDMFLTELKETEYGYTGEIGDALDHIGVTSAEVESDERYAHALKRACETIVNAER